MPSVAGIPAQAQTASLSAIRPNAFNPNQMDSFMYAKEIASIQKFGFVVPVIVREVGDDLEIVDGEHRWKVANEIGMTEIPIWNLGPLSDAVAKQLTLVLNETRGSPEKQKLSDLLKDLLKSETTEELLTVLPFSKEKFNELVDVPAFDWESFENQSSTRSEDTWVERIYRLPSDAARVLDEAIAAAKEDEDTPDGIALERIAADFLGR